MATVPPGNKQVGTVKAIAVSSLKLDGSDASIFAAESVVGFGVLAAPNPPSPTAPKNAMVGKLSLTSISGGAADTVNAESVVGFAVLRYNPPQVFNAESLVGFSVLSDTTNTSEPSKPKNAAICSLELTALTSSTSHTVNCDSVVGFLVLREFQPRKEHVTMTIEYGAEAKLNQGASQ